MDIFPSTFIGSSATPLYTDNQDFMLLDQLPQSGYGSLFINTSEIGGPYGLGFLLLSEDNIASMCEDEFEKKLGGPVQKILQYAKDHPSQDQYLFVLGNS